MTTKKDAGFSLLEGLLSVLVLSIGLLGLAKLQATLWNESSRIHNREIALIISQSVIEHRHSSWINRPEFTSESASTLFKRSHQIADFGDRTLNYSRVNWSDRGRDRTMTMESSQSVQNPKDVRWILPPN